MLREKAYYRDLYAPRYLELFSTEPVEELSKEQRKALEELQDVVSRLTRQQLDVFRMQARRRQVYFVDNKPILPEGVDADLLAFQIVYTFWNRFNSSPERYEEGLAKSGHLGALLRLLKEKDEENHA